jgi:hypothetical protein
MRSILPAAVFAAVALAAVAAADARAAAKGARTSDESLLAKAVAGANTVCGAAITAKLTHASARGAGPDPEDRAVSARRCRDVFDAIRSVCRTAAGRAAVAAQIRRVSCSVNGERPAVALENGMLDYRVQPGFETWNDSRGAFDYLADHLQVDGQPLVVQIVKPLEEAALADQMAQTNRQCGTSITATFDWTGVSAQEIKARSPSNYCSHALDAVVRVCGDAAGREAVARQIKRIVCGHADARSISLGHGVLEFKSDFRSSGDRGAVFEYLQNAL